MDDVEKRADRKIVALLVSAGVDVASRSTMTQELFDPEPFVDDPRPPLPEAPAFTVDDLIDFHFKLLDDDAIHEFFASH